MYLNWNKILSLSSIPFLLPALPATFSENPPMPHPTLQVIASFSLIIIINTYVCIQTHLHTQPAESVCVVWCEWFRSWPLCTGRPIRGLILERLILFLPVFIACSSWSGSKPEKLSPLHGNMFFDIAIVLTLFVQAFLEDSLIFWFL